MNDIINMNYLYHTWHTDILILFLRYDTISFVHNISTYWYCCLYSYHTCGWSAHYFSASLHTAHAAYLLHTPYYLVPGTPLPAPRSRPMPLPQHKNIPIISYLYPFLAHLDVPSIVYRPPCWLDRFGLQVMEEVNMLKVAGAHPNVVTMQAFFEDQDSFYIVMEMCQGGELYHRLADKVYRVAHFLLLDLYILSLLLFSFFLSIFVLVYYVVFIFYFYFCVLFYL